MDFVKYSVHDVNFHLSLRYQVDLISRHVIQAINTFAFSFGALYIDDSEYFHKTSIFFFNLVDIVRRFYTIDLIRKHFPNESVSIGTRFNSISCICPFSIYVLFILTLTCLSVCRKNPSDLLADTNSIRQNVLLICADTCEK